jgi:subtilisin family serine protease
LITSQYPLILLRFLLFCCIPVQVFFSSLTEGVTDLTGLTNRWDQIILFDASGRGADFVLDEAWLVEVTTDTRAVAITGIDDQGIVAASSDDGSPLELATPIIGAESILEAENPNRWIVRLAPGVTNADVQTFCTEGEMMVGSPENVYDTSSTSPPAFNCVRFSEDAVSTSSEIDPDAEAFTFVAVAVEDEADLVRLTAQYGDQILYVERDLQAQAHVFDEDGEAVGSSNVTMTMTSASQQDISPLLRATTWGLDRIDQPRLPLDGQYNPPRVLEEGTTPSTPAHVYILDTGCRGTHREFADRLGASTSMVGGTGLQDEQGHGTHTTGTTAGATLRPGPRQQGVRFVLGHHQRAQVGPKPRGYERYWYRGRKYESRGATVDQSQRSRRPDCQPEHRRGRFRRERERRRLQRFARLQPARPHGW